MAAAFTAILYYHFVCAFFNKSAGKGAYLGYAGLIGFAIYMSQGGIVKSAHVVDGILYHELDAVAYLLSAFSLMFAGIAIIYLIQGFRRATDPQARNRIGYMLVAIFVCLPFALTNFVPALTNYSADHLGNIAMAVVISYTILRYQLLDIQFVARRALTYFLVIVCLAGIYVGVILLGHSLFPGQPIYIVLLLAAGLALVLAVMARPLRYRIQEWVDRFFYREAYQYRQTLLSFSSRMGNILNLDELANEMLTTISKALRITQARLLFEDTNTGHFTTQFTYPKAKGKSPGKLKFSLDNPIVALMEKEANSLNLKQIDSTPQLKGLWQTEKEKLVASNLELLCPLKSRGKLIGILALGSKQSGNLYAQSDVEMVMSMANQAGIMMENARMFDSLRNQQARMEQLLTQAVLAQEEERKRISVDLHDSVAQWLVAASYHAQTCSQVLSGDDNDVARSELADMESTISKSLKELRRVVIGLRPPVLDELGLNYALQQSLEDLKSEGLNCRFSVAGTPLRLPPETEIAVYRVVQETLNNIRKHAKASRINLRLRFQEDKLQVEIRDNGVGFDLSHALDSAISVGRVGLLGMKQRAEMLGGDLSIETGEGTGTAITLSVPIQPQEEDE